MSAISESIGYYLGRLVTSIFKRKKAEKTEKKRIEAAITKEEIIEMVKTLPPLVDLPGPLQSGEKVTRRVLYDSEDKNTPELEHGSAHAWLSDQADQARKALKESGAVLKPSEKLTRQALRALKKRSGALLIVAMAISSTASTCMIDFGRGFGRGVIDCAKDKNCGAMPTPTMTPDSSPTPTETPGPTIPSPTPTSSPVPSPTATVTPTSVPTVSAPVLPVMTRWKIGGFGQTCKLGDICCHNPESGDQFQKHHICEVGSTQLFDYADKSKRHLRHSGPCDPPHEVTWVNVCNQRDYDVVGGPGIEIRGAVSWRKSPNNPHHTLVEFIPGQDWEICAYAPLNGQTVDGITVPVEAGNETCSYHRY